MGVCLFYLMLYNAFTDTKRWQELLARYDSHFQHTPEWVKVVTETYNNIKPLFCLGEDALYTAFLIKRD